MILLSRSSTVLEKVFGPAARHSVSLCLGYRVPKDYLPEAAASYTHHSPPVYWHWSEKERFPRSVVIPCRLRQLVECRAEPLRIPFTLSRLAAAQAIDVVRRGGACPSVSALCVLDRRQSWEADGLERTIGVSLAHEDDVGVAAAWRVGLPLAGAEEGTCSAGIVSAVDVVPVGSVQRLLHRFPHFRTRMVPQCCPAPLSCCDCDACAPFFSGTGEGEPHAAASYLGATHSPHDPREGHHSSSRWWYGALGVGAREFLAAVAVSQHWSVRECCVKLLGVPLRSFAYRALHTSQSFCSAPTGNAAPAALPRGLLRSYEVYASHVTGREATAMTSLGLDPSWLRIMSWLEWVPRHTSSEHTNGSDVQWMPHVVTVVVAKTTESK